MQIKHYILIFLSILFSEFIQSQDSFEIDNFSANSESFYSIQKTPSGSKGFSAENISMGIFGGVNFSLVIPTFGNSVFSSNGGNYSKEYDAFYKNIGYQMGFLVRYNLSREIKISIQPATIEYSFGYQNQYSWQGTTNLSYLVEHNQNMRFFEIPLMIGYFFRAEEWQPYIQAGGYYARLMSSNSYADVTETTDFQTLQYSTTVNSNGIYKKNQYGVLVGGGLRYAAGKTMIGVEANYRFLLSKLSSTATRFDNNQTIGNYDISDELLLNNLAISIIVTVPLVCKDSKNGPYIFCQSN